MARRQRFGGLWFTCIDRGLWLSEDKRFVVSCSFRDIREWRCWSLYRTGPGPEPVPMVRRGRYTREWWDWSMATELDGSGVYWMVEIDGLVRRLLDREAAGL